MGYLIVRQPGQVAFSIPVRDGLQVGRHQDNDLVLADHQVSRMHMALEGADRRWQLTDRGSTHGTFVNGQRVEQASLEDGDQIQVGNVLMTFVLADELHEIVHHQITQLQTPPLLRDTTDKRLALLYEASAAIRAIAEVDELLSRMLRAVIDVLDCERGMVGLVDPAGLRRFEATRTPGRGAEVVVSRAILQSVLERRDAVIVRDTSERNPTLAGQGVLSAMCVPLSAGQRVLGFLYVDDRAHENRFQEQDLTYLSALAHLTAAAVEAAERYRSAVDVAEALHEAAACDELIGTSAPIQELKAQLRKIAAAAGAHVLIRGESGTGKELVARTMHALSPRANQPFMTVNCAAIPETMIEAELFGYEKGAFTGAAKEKRGKFLLANRGTLFLDEIGDLSPAAQAKVLRAIQEGEVQPLGSERTLRVDVRILSATHKDLLSEVSAGRFREDLYYRLNVVELLVPPLRERGDDIALLAERFLRSAGLRMGKRLDGFTPEALAALRKHRWPGNVRELQNEAERAAILGESRWIDVTDLSPRILAQSSPSPSAERNLAERYAELEPTERVLVEAALRKAGGNVSEAARLLGISRIMVKRRMERFQLRGSDEE